MGWGGRGERRRGLELVAVGLLLVALAALAYGSHVVDGGFSSDDWSNAAVYETQGYAAAVSDYRDAHPGRELLALLDPARFAVLGSADPVPHLLLAVALGVLTSLVLYALLRELRFGVVAACLIAALVLVFPWADSIRLWPTANLNAIGVLLFLVGLILSLRSFHTSKVASRALAGAGTLGLAASVLTYQATAGLGLLAGALYLERAPTRRALMKWGVDAVAVGGVSAYTAIAALEGGGPPLRAQIENAVELAWTSGSLALTALVPPAMSAALRLPVAIVAVAVVTAAAWTGWRGAPVGPSSGKLRRLVVVALAAVVAALASYAPFAGTTYFSAWSPGLENRVNILASIPLVVFAYAVVALAGLLLGRLRPGIPRLPMIFTVVAMLAIGSGYLVRLDDHKSHWARAADEADTVLEVVDSAAPDLPSGSTLFTFGQRGQVAPGVHVFAAAWDLRGAVRLHRDDPSLEAYPALTGVSFRCRERGMSAAGSFYLNIERVEPETVYGYGTVYFVDVPTGASDRIDGPQECREAVARYEPGPWL